MVVCNLWWAGEGQRTTVELIPYLCVSAVYLIQVVCFL